MKNLHLKGKKWSDGVRINHKKISLRSESEDEW
jgi:hypothetical protein